MKLCAEKTKLQVYSTKTSEAVAHYMKEINPITIEDEKIDFCENAEHVGVVRSTAGNLPAILARISSLKKSLGAVLHTGVARGHRGNPAASLRIIQLFGAPVLFSGLAQLHLLKSEENIVDQHYKELLMNVQRLLPCTPRSVTFFLAGSLPGVALLHLRYLGAFGMICRLPENILNKHAVNLFTYVTVSSKSWFLKIRELCLQYGLPHPIVLLREPLSKDQFKKLIKTHVLDYWEQVLRQEASVRDSLSFFDPAFMSLTKPHPIWTSAGCSPAKVAMATIQGQMLSGRYRTEELCSNWSTNKSGTCRLSPECSSTIENLPHILASCPALDQIREKLSRFTTEYCKNNCDSFPAVSDIVKQFCTTTNPNFCQFLLDCSTIPAVISAHQLHGMQLLDHLFHITRTWVYTIHKSRMKILGRWNPF